MTKEIDDFIKTIEGNYIKPDLDHNVFHELQFTGSMIDETLDIFSSVMKEMKYKENVSSMENIDTDNMRPRSLDRKLTYMKNFFDKAYIIRMINDSLFNRVNIISSEFNNMTKENKIMIKLEKEFLGFSYIEIEKSLSHIYINLANYEKIVFKPGYYYDDQLCLKFDDIDNKKNMFLFHYLTYNYNL
ncbi:hypothetical protein [Staphylococcus phage LY01]|nr:hypothetical protein [Staphylococcus phage LY01]